jgi:hypothetical protein
MIYVRYSECMSNSVSRSECGQNFKNDNAEEFVTQKVNFF